MNHRHSRRIMILTFVVCIHVLGLWALHGGLLRRLQEAVIPVQVIAELIEAPRPVVTQTPPPAPPRPQPQPRQPAPQPPTPRPVVVPPQAPLPTASSQTAPSAVVVPQPAPMPAMTTPATEAVTTAPAPPAPPAPAQVELPSSSADYLNNPRPPYPPLSKRLGEQGRVVVRVFIETNGTATRAEIRSSSGYDRLDQTALQTVLRWRYVPGKRNGVAEAMWFNVPISFVLE